MVAEGQHPVAHADLAGADPALLDRPAARSRSIPGTREFPRQWRRDHHEQAQQYRLHTIDLTRPAVLEKGCVYIVPLQEELALPAHISGKANPKSSTGRLDIFTRLITDEGRQFEIVPAGYRGRLYAEVVPRTFSVVVRQGERLSQLRLFQGDYAPSDALLRQT